MARLLTQSVAPLKRIVATAAVAAVIGLQAFTMSVAAATSPGPAQVFCNNWSNSLGGFPAIVQPQAGFRQQWITARYYIYRVESAEWIHIDGIDHLDQVYETPLIKTVYDSFGDPMTAITPNRPAFNLTTFAPGHYVVYVQYFWWSGRVWSAPTSLQKTTVYNVSLSTSAGTLQSARSGSCPVDLFS